MKCLKCQKITPVTAEISSKPLPGEISSKPVKYANYKT